MKLAAQRCSQKVVGARNLQPENLLVKEAIKLKNEAFRAWLAQGSPKAADTYQEAEAKTHVEEEFREAMVSSGKPSDDSGWKSRAWLRLCSAGEENFRP